MRSNLCSLAGLLSVLLLAATLGSFGYGKFFFTLEIHIFIYHDKYLSRFLLNIWLKENKYFKASF